MKIYQGDLLAAAKKMAALSEKNDRINAKRLARQQAANHATALELDKRGML